MDKDGELNDIIQEELLWVEYRLKMLDIIEIKLRQMKALAASVTNHPHENYEIDRIQGEINILAMEIFALDNESKKDLPELGD